MGKSCEMRLAHLCCCCLLYQIGVLSNETVSGKFCRVLRLAFQGPQRRRGTHGSVGLVQLVRGEQGSVGSKETGVWVRRRGSRL